MAVCCEIVETKGLEVIGIYRVPGNNAGVHYLIRELNKGAELINMEEEVTILTI